MPSQEIAIVNNNCQPNPSCLTGRPADQRRCPRIGHCIPAELKYQDASGESHHVDGTILNICKLGTVLSLPWDDSPAALCRKPVRIVLTQAQGEVEWFGRVVRVAQEGGGLYLLGVEFKEEQTGIFSDLASHQRICVILEPD